MTNNFESNFFIANRQRLSEALPNSLIIISAHNMLQYSADEPYKFRQDSSFWYLTGINEPDLLLVIDTAAGEAVLLLPEQNEYQKEWDGELSKPKLKKISGVSSYKEKSDLPRLLKEAKNSSKQICYLAPLPGRIEPYGFYSNPARKSLEAEIKKVESKPKDIRLELAKLRQIKQPVEIEAIRQAIKITGDSLDEVKARIKDFNNESEIARAFTVSFLMKGSDGHKFDPIVASAENAATIHYKQNNTKVKNNSLLLLDLGASTGMYGADISRTWAVGKPTKRQTDIYNAVLEVHRKSLARFKSGIQLKEEQERVNEDLAKQYKKLKLEYRQLPTGLSHFLGIDTHDAGDYMSPLQEGMVLTVEPGIYLADEGIGVRIEDNILITKDGAEVLSQNISYNL